MQIRKQLHLYITIAPTLIISLGFRCPKHLNPKPWGFAISTID